MHGRRITQAFPQLRILFTGNTALSRGHTRLTRLQPQSERALLSPSESHVSGIQSSPRQFEDLYLLHCFLFPSYHLFSLSFPLFLSFFGYFIGGLPRCQHRCRRGCIATPPDTIEGETKRPSRLAFNYPKICAHNSIYLLYFLLAVYFLRNFFAVSSIPRFLL